MPRHFGLLVPSTNTTCEMELCRLAPDLQLHTARLGKEGKSPFAPSRYADLAYQSRMLGDAKVEVIALAQTSASLFEEGYDDRAKKVMTENSGGIAAITSAEAVGEALRALGATRIAIATPYSDEVIGRTKRYYETRYGVTVVAAQSLGAEDAYAIGKMDASMAEAVFAKIDTPAVEALLVPGGNFPTLDRIAAWERRFGKPVVTTNQAALWGILNAMKITAPIEGWGRLLARGGAV